MRARVKEEEKKSSGNELYKDEEGGRTEGGREREAWYCRREVRKGRLRGGRKLRVAAALIFL